MLYCVFRAQNLLRNQHDEIERKNIETHFANPLNAFQLIKRSTYDLQTIEKRIINQAGYFYQKVEHFASDSDLIGAVEGILRLQKFYKLKVADLADGIIDGCKTDSRLSNDELFLIGSKAHDLNEEHLAQEYLKLSLKRTREEISRDDVLFTLMNSYKASGDFKKAITTSEAILESDPTALAAILMKDELESLVNGEELKKLKIPAETFQKDGNFQIDKEEIIYKKACRGELIKNITESSKLRCHYLTSNYFTILAPFKAEEINLRPKILLFFDVLSDSEIQHLKKLSSSKFYRASTFTNNDMISKERIAQVAWHTEKDDVIRRISQRTEDMTSLNVKSSEELQIQNYGIGGHYSLHWDHRLKNQPQFNLGIGNRFATVLFYVSEFINDNFNDNFKYYRCQMSKKAVQPFFHTSKCMFHQ